MSQPHIVIFAGGQGQRLGGVRKADLRLGGKTLVDHVAERLTASGVKMVAIGRGTDHRAPPRGFLPVQDLAAPVAGPLAGLAAAVAALRARGIGEGLVVSAAVDTPFLPHDFVAHMQEGLGTASAAYALWRDQPYPTNAIWRLEALADLPRQVTDGTAPNSLRRLLEQVGGFAVDWSAKAAVDPFANVNTVADLLALTRRLTEPEPSPVIHKRGN